MAATSLHDPPVTQQYPMVLPSATPAGTPAASSSTPSASPSSKPSTPEVSPAPLQTVQPALPENLSIPELGINASFKPLKNSGTPSDIILNPSVRTRQDLLTAWRWIDRPLPGYPAIGPTYIVGHACRAKNCPAVFNTLQPGLVKIGMPIVITTSRGRLTYRVAKYEAIPFSKPAEVGKMLVQRDYPLVLIVCLLNPDGSDYTANFVVYANLVKAEAG